MLWTRSSQSYLYKELDLVFLHCWRRWNWSRGWVGRVSLVSCRLLRLPTDSGSPWRPGKERCDVGVWVWWKRERGVEGGGIYSFQWMFIRFISSQSLGESHPVPAQALPTYPLDVLLYLPPSWLGGGYRDFTSISWGMGSLVQQLWHKLSGLKCKTHLTFAYQNQIFSAI